MSFWSAVPFHERADRVAGKCSLRREPETVKGAKVSMNIGWPLCGGLAWTSGVRPWAKAPERDREQGEGGI